MTNKPPDFAELNALAIEACDMWQEHLSTLASDPVARSELTRFLEPQRRLFADWVSMIQKAPSPNPDAYPAATTTENNFAGERHDNHQQRSHANTSADTDAPQTVSTSRGDADGDDALRVAQLAYRVAELEKRLGQLESLLAGQAGSSRRAQRTTS